MVQEFKLLAYGTLITLKHNSEKPFENSNYWRWLSGGNIANYGGKMSHMYKTILFIK